MNPRLCVENLTKTFPDHEGPVIEDVSFCVHPGEVVALVGPSGCGKTTTLRTIMGFERADRGRVLHDERLLQDERRRFVPPEKRGVGFVFQDYALFPHLSVIRNVMFGLRKVPRRRRRQVARECLWMVGLMDMEDRKPQELSGGQQQRVAIARAIAPGSRIILLDEPFSNLDPDLRQATRNEVRMLAHRARLGVVLVTHDQEEALSTADQLAVMKDGRLQQVGTPEQVYTRPADAFVAQFLGRTNLIQATARGDVADTGLGALPLDRDAAGGVLLSLRPEHLSMTPVNGGAGVPPVESGAGVPPAEGGTGVPPVESGAGVPPVAGSHGETDASTGGHAGHGATDPHRVGQIVSREFKGHDLTYRVRLNKTEYLVQTDFTIDLPVGQPVRLEPNTRAAVIETNALPQVTGGADTSGGTGVPPV